MWMLTTQDRLPLRFYSGEFLRPRRGIQGGGERNLLFKGSNMKRSIVAIALAALASPALAAENGPPFEQVQLDRVLPDIQVNRATTARRPQFAAAAGMDNTRSDAPAYGEMRGAAGEESPWAKDFHFIAPPL